MKLIGPILQLLIVAVAVYAAIVQKKNKLNKNKWGKGPLSFSDIFSTNDTITPQLRATLRVYADDLYLYVKNTGKSEAKKVNVHSKEVEAIDVDTDAQGMSIQPGEEITYFINSFEYKRISKVTISWYDSLGRHKRSFFVKSRSNE